MNINLYTVEKFIKLVDIKYNAPWTFNRVLITKFSFKFPFKEKTNYFNMKAREKLFIGIALKTLYKSTRKMRSWIFDNTHTICEFQEI